MKKNSLVTAVAMTLGSVGTAQAAIFSITYMDFPGSPNSTVVGTANTGAGTGTFTSGGTPFFGHAWTSVVSFGNETTGPGVWNFSTGSGASATGTYNYSLAAGQVAMGVLFSWGTSAGIPILNILNADGSGVDIDGDGILGTKMATGPFVAHSIGFAGTAIPVPAAVWLFGSGLLGLLGVARRRC